MSVRSVAYIGFYCAENLEKVSGMEIVQNKTGTRQCTWSIFAAIRFRYPSRSIDALLGVTGIFGWNL